MITNSDKNILILTTVSGFLCKFEIENVKLLQQLGYIVHYATNMKEQHYYFDENELKELGVQTHHIDIERSPYMLRANKRALSRLIEIIQIHNIQTIHAHTPVGGLLSRLAVRRLKERKLKSIYTAHGFHFYKGAPLLNNTIYYYVEKKLARHTDILIVINDEDYQNAKKLRLRANGKVHKIEGAGLDLDKFQPLSEEQRDKQRNKLGLKKDDFFALSIGELNANKNQEIILKTLAKKRQVITNAKSFKYGICGDGFLEEQIESTVQQLKLEDMVILLGYQKNVSAILGCADCLIFPSKREGLGMVGLEALAMQIPVIASDNRGTREYMQHTKNGYVCEYNDIEGFAQGIDYIMNLTKQQQKEMKEHAKNCVKRFDKKIIAQKMKAIYLELDKML